MKPDVFSDVANTHFDLRIFVCGYEERARYVAHRLQASGEITLVLDYECRRTLSYDDNKIAFSELGGAFVPINGALQTSLQAHLQGLRSSNVSVLFDVSSCSRSVM